MPNIDNSLQKDLNKYEDTTYDSLQKQIEAEYNIAWLHQYTKIQKNLLRLKIYNNQKRDADAVGDPLLFTIHQTVLASLYDDQLMVNFEGREEGDVETAQNLNNLARFDYEKMGKDVSDYMWDWDTLFFGRGLVLMMDFDRSKELLCPVPEVLDPMTFLRDPKAVSVNGDIRGRGGMRFGGRELWLKRDSLTPENGYFDTKYLHAENELKALITKAQSERDNAQGLTFTFNKDADSKLGDNSLIAGLQWFTYWKGRRVMAVLVNGRKRIIKYYELPQKNMFPIIDRPMYPHSHSWDGTSISDLVEDKQRQRAIAINLGMQAMHADLYPMYLYDEDRIKNKGDLLNFEFNKFVGVQNNEGKDISGAVRPLNKPTIRMDFVNFILNTLDTSAQRATATPEMQQGQISNERRTLGELNLVASKVDTRYSLTAKVFSWSEKAFWRQWYSLYKEFFADGIDEKVIRIVGSLSSKWRPLKRDDIITSIDPDVTIESRVLSEAKQVRERILMQGYGNLLLLDPSANKRFFLKKLGQMNGFKEDEMTLLLPPTSEELNAEDENITLNQNKLVQVQPNDDHMTHLEIHNKADENAAKAAHIKAHKVAMTVKRNQPELFPQPQQVDANGNPIQPVTPTNLPVTKPTSINAVLNATPSKVANPQLNPLA